MGDSDFSDSRPQALARLAALQRLRDQMARDSREASLRAIDALIEQEMRALRELRDLRDDGPMPAP